MSIFDPLIGRAKAAIGRAPEMRHRPSPFVEQQLAAFSSLRM